MAGQLADRLRRVVGPVRINGAFARRDFRIRGAPQKMREHGVCISVKLDDAGLSCFFKRMQNNRAGVVMLDLDRNRRILAAIVGSSDAAWQDLLAAARESAATFDTWLRNTIETQPYTVAPAALGIGWLLGRMHRPI